MGSLLAPVWRALSFFFLVFEFLFVRPIVQWFVVLACLLGLTLSGYGYLKARWDVFVLHAQHKARASPSSWFSVVVSKLFPSRSKAAPREAPSSPSLLQTPTRSQNGNITPRDAILTNSPLIPVGNYLRRSMKISVIIPAYNESSTLAATLERLDEYAVERDSIEVLVVNAQSSDDTVDVANRTFHKLRFPTKRLLQSSSGRATAQNIGAEQATGDILFFLHADTLVPLGYDARIRDTIFDRSVIAGAFAFGVNRKSFKSRPPAGLGIMEHFTNFRCNHFWLSYGDQGLFILRSRFQQLGPFPNLPMMEDFEMSRRVRKQALTEGSRVVFLQETALCSGRRWEKNGVLKNTLLNQWFVFAYTSLGHSATQVFEWYYGKPAVAQAKKPE